MQYLSNFLVFLHIASKFKEKLFLTRISCKNGGQKYKHVLWPPTVTQNCTTICSNCKKDHPKQVLLWWQQGFDIFRSLPPYGKPKNAFSRPRVRIGDSILTFPFNASFFVVICNLEHQNPYYDHLYGRQGFDISGHCLLTIAFCKTLLKSLDRRVSTFGSLFTFWLHLKIIKRFPTCLA